MNNTFAINRAEAEKSFHDYTAAYDLDDAKVALKVEHTFRVAGLCDVISDSLGMTGYDKDLAWLLGMLHDIGRFEQVRRYHTFRDALSVNHAELSADILFREGLIKNFIKVEDDPAESDDYLLTEKAIRLHNVFQLPDDLTERELRFATILRDADKLDILRVNVETPRSTIYNVPDEIFLDSDGLVYPVSVRLMREQGYLETVLQFPSRNPRTRQRFAVIRRVVHDYMEKRLSGVLF